MIDFHNPSIRDYLLHEIDKEHELVKYVLKSAVHFEQLEIISKYDGQNEFQDEYTPDFSEILDHCQDIFLEKLEELFDSTSSEYKSIKTKDRTKYRKKTFNLNERLNFILDVLENYDSEIKEDSLDEILSTYTKQIQENTNSNIRRKYEVLNSLYASHEVSEEFCHEILHYHVDHLIKTKENLWFSDLEIFLEDMTEIQLDYSQYLTEELKMEFKSSIQELINEEWEHLIIDENDPEIIEMMADELRHYSEKLGIKYQEDFDRAMKKADELYAKQDMAAEAEIDEYRIHSSSKDTSDSKVSYTPTEEIDHMFTKLE